MLHFLYILFLILGHYLLFAEAEISLLFCAKVQKHLYFYFIIVWRKSWINTVHGAFCWTRRQWHDWSSPIDPKNYLNSALTASHWKSKVNSFLNLFTSLSLSPSEMCHSNKKSCRYTRSTNEWNENVMRKKH